MAPSSRSTSERRAYLDFPILLKLRTERIGNFAPYALIGGKLSRDMQSQADVNQSLQDGYILKLAKGNSSVDVVLERTSSSPSSSSPWS